MKKWKNFLLFGMLALLCFLGTAFAMPNIEPLTRLAVKLICALGFVVFGIEAVKNGDFALIDLLQSN